MQIHTWIRSSIRASIRSCGIDMYSLHTSTYWYVFWHVFCLYRAFAVLIPTNTDLNTWPGTGSDTYQYVQHYMPIQTTTCQYRPLRAYYTLEYMLSTCQTAPSPQYEPPLSVGRTTHPTPAYIESKQLIVVRVAVKCARRRSNERPVLVMPS